MATPSATPPPEGFHYETRPRWRLVRIGALMFGISYAATAIASWQYLNKGESGIWAWGFVPVAGPLVGIARFHEDGLPGVTVVVDVFLAADALAEGVGAALLVSGFARPETVLVRNDNALWRFVPRPLRLAPGLALFGVSGAF
jgi:hypothetical protein